MYAFADSDTSGLTAWAGWMEGSPVRRDVLDIKVVYQQRHVDVDISTVPQVFLPRTGPFELVDYGCVFATHPDDDIFDARGVDRAGCVVVVRPDQYVAAVLPLDATDELAAFLGQHLLASGSPGRAGRRPRRRTRRRTPPPGR